MVYINFSVFASLLIADSRIGLVNVLVLFSYTNPSKFSTFPPLFPCRM